MQPVVSRHTKSRKTNFELLNALHGYRQFISLNRSDGRWASLSQSTTMHFISIFLLRFSFTFDGFIELIYVLVLVDMASAFLYHSVIHDIQLRNRLRCRRRYLWDVYFSFYKSLQALMFSSVYSACKLCSCRRVSRYLGVGNVDHTTLIQTLFSIHYFTRYFRSRNLQRYSLMPIDTLLHFSLP